MDRLIRDVVVSGAAVLMLPQLLLLWLSPTRRVILADTRRWAAVLDQPRRPEVWALLRLLAEHREFRNLFYYRVGRGSIWRKLLVLLFKLVYPEIPTLSISARGAIGEGLFIQHGFGTIVGADQIGKNCFISHQVAIGFANKTDCPILGNNVRVMAGAKILGAVHIGDNVIVGANAVVTKNVPADSVVIGVPARIVRRHGVKVDEPLE